MKFSNLTVTAEGASYTFQPYDRGAKGAFVYRQEGMSVYAPRVVVSTTTDDNASDKYSVQLNVPRTCVTTADCDVPRMLGTDLVKTELRFLATTSLAQRKLAISQVIALLEEIRRDIQDRSVIYV